LDFVVHPLSQFIFDFLSFGLPLFGVRDSEHFKAFGSFASTGVDEAKKLLNSVIRAKSYETNRKSFG